MQAIPNPPVILNVTVGVNGSPEETPEAQEMFGGSNWHRSSPGTVDGRNPVPVDVVDFHRCFPTAGPEETVSQRHLCATRITDIRRGREKSFGEGRVVQQKYRLGYNLFRWCFQRLVCEWIRRAPTKHLEMMMMMMMMMIPIFSERGAQICFRTWVVQIGHFKVCHSQKQKIIISKSGPTVQQKDVNQNSAILKIHSLNH